MKIADFSSLLVLVMGMDSLAREKCSSDMAHYVWGISAKEED